MRLSKLLRLFFLVGAIVVVPSLPGHAADGLHEYLERAASAEYSAEQVVSCSTPDGQRDSVVEISHSPGMLVVRPTVGDGASIEVGAGAVTSGDGSGMAVRLGDAVEPGAHYAISRIEPGVVAGRAVEAVSVVDDLGVDRADLSFDVDSGALLRTSIFNSDGSVWCEMYLVDVEIGVSGPGLPDSEGVRLGPVEAPNDPRLPETAAGLDRLDVYEWAGNGVVGYYSDGLFSFTVLASSGPITLDGRDVVEVETETGNYSRWFGPGNVAYGWESDAGGVAVFGDIPIDMQDRLLKDLPRPHAPGVFRRLWRGIFD